MKRIEPRRLATVCLPWSDRGEFLEAVFRNQVRCLRRGGFDNLYIFGTAGEGYAVTDAVYGKIAAVFFDEMRAVGPEAGSAAVGAATGSSKADGTAGTTACGPADGLCQLGVIGLSVAQIRERIEAGLAIGFYDFQISFPSWGALTDQEIARFFRDILGQYPQARFLHYNTGRSGRVLTGGEYARLSAEYPNLVATKSGGHTVASLMSLLNGAPELCHFVTELDYAAACLFGGECGLLVSVSSIHPARCREFFDAGQRGNTEALRRMTRELYGIRARVLDSVAQEHGHMDGAFDKLYARLADPEFPLDMLSPYRGASPAVFEGFKTWLAKEAPDWALS